MKLVYFVSLFTVLFTSLHGGRLARADIAIKGVDASSLRKNEDKGARYFYASGFQSDALTILRDGGANTVRVRVFVNSPDGYHGKTEVLQVARRVKSLGMKLLVDFHYSDTWADPAHQTKPRAWTNFTLAQLNTAVFNHTKDICSALAAQGTPADFVQIGNEINDGMLWPNGRLSANGNSFANLAQLIRSGANGAKQAHAATAVVLHLAAGGSPGIIQWWFDGLKSQGIDWDVTGLSYYTWWHGTFSDLKAGLGLAATRYKKPVLVVETSYPWTLAPGDSAANIISKPSQLLAAYPASLESQYKVMRVIIDIVSAVPNGLGAGIVYWDGTWTAVPGNGWDNFDPSSGNNWENQALFDYSGKETWGVFNLSRHRPMKDVRR